MDTSNNSPNTSPIRHIDAEVLKHIEEICNSDSDSICLASHENADLLEEMVDDTDQDETYVPSSESDSSTHSVLSIKRKRKSQEKNEIKKSLQLLSMELIMQI